MGKGKNFNETDNASVNIKHRLLAAAQLAVILAIIIGIPLYLIFMNPEMWHNFKSIEAFDAFLERYEEKSIPIYLLCQIVQVVVTVIPGQVIQIAGGYIYGFPLALLLSVSGVAAGSTIGFFIARKLGQRPMAVIFGEEKFMRYKAALDTKRAHKIIFLIYLIPGLPKDMAAYAAGVSAMRYPAFMMLSIMGRLPSMAASLLMGTMLDTESYTGAVILGAAVCLICIMCFIKRKSIMNITDRYYEAMSSKSENK